MPNNELKDFKQRFEEGEFAQSAELSTRYLDENILIFDNIRVLANPDPVRLQMNMIASCQAGNVRLNINGKVIMYADTITASMQQTIDETARRRQIQLKYNADHGITPQQIRKDIKGTLSAFADAQLHDAQKPVGTGKAVDSKQTPKRYQPYIEPEGYAYAADPIVKRMSRKQLEKSIADTTELMKEAAKQLDFLQAAQYRDEIVRLQSLLDEETEKLR